NLRGRAHARAGSPMRHLAAARVGKDDPLVRRQLFRRYRRVSAVIYIIGGRGYVGSGFARYCRARGLPHQVITRENYGQFAGHSCDALVNANGNSRKYLADRDPVAEFDQSVRSVAVSLSVFKAGSYVLISTGDVYGDPSGTSTTEEGRELD